MWQIRHETTDTILHSGTKAQCEMILNAFGIYNDSHRIVMEESVTPY